jgi:cation/acetate symporter
MVHLPRTQSINPRLGLYFGIYASLIVALVLVTLLVEQLALPDPVLRSALLLGPFALYAALAAGTIAHEPLDFFAAGRRIPAVISGLALAVTALGSVGIVALTGAVGLMGLDAFALLLGFPAGLVFMGVLLVPYLRKFGAYTIPSYLAARLESHAVRPFAAAILAVPVLLILIAELRMAAFVAGQLIDTPESVRIIALATLVGAIATLGGMRGVSWTAAAKGMALLFAIAVPATIASMYAATLPLPQLTSGNILRNLGQTETARAIPILQAAPLVLDLPADGLSQISKRFLKMYGHVGPFAFSGAILVVLAGVAAMPGLLLRAGTTTGVQDARKSMGWAVLILGFILLTLVSCAIFARAILIEQIVGVPLNRTPAWFQALADQGFVATTGRGGATAVSSLQWHRDGVLLGLPDMIGLPAGIAYLLAAGVLAAAMAAIAAHGLALAMSLSEDVIHGTDPDRVADGPRVLTARIAAAVVMAVAAIVALIPADPLRLMLWALALAAASTFPVLVLSVFWKRLNGYGAIAGMATGLGTALAGILANILGVGGLQGPLPGFTGMLASTLAAVIVTRVTPSVGRGALEQLRDMRVPGGETLLDRQRRIQRQKQVPHT